MPRKSATPQQLRAMLLLFAALAVLWAAYGFQAAGYQPCELCLLQRWPWRAVIILSSLVLLRPAWGRALMPLCGLVLAGGAVLAAYHAGVEYHWWKGPQECTGTLGRIESAQALIDRLNHTNVIRCDQAAWTLFGISMAGYNALVSAALAAWVFISQGKARV